MQEAGPVLLKNFTRSSKQEPKVVEVDLINSTPNYALIRHPDGREQTINLRYLARKPRNKPKQEWEEEEHLYDRFQHLKITDSDRFQELDAGDSLNNKGNNHLQTPTQIKGEPKDRWEDHTIALCNSDHKFLREVRCKYS